MYYNICETTKLEESEMKSGCQCDFKQGKKTSCQLEGDFKHGNTVVAKVISEVKFIFKHKISLKTGPRLS